MTLQRIQPGLRGYTRVIYDCRPCGSVKAIPIPVSRKGREKNCESA
jgi:hypothetical protein